MILQDLYSPFDEMLLIELVDMNCQPVLLSTLIDVQVLLKVNNTVKLKYKMIADGDWLAWEPGDDTTSIFCPVTEAQSDGWRGLLMAEVQQVIANADFPGGVQYQSAKPVTLYSIKKSRFTTVPAPTPNPITFTTTFSCDIDKRLNFGCLISAPAGNYIIQVKIEDEWRRLYKGYLEKDSADATYSIVVSEGEQIAAGNYVMRVQNAVTGVLSEEVPCYLPDCREGERDERQWKWDGNYYLFSPFGWY
jgi:hypothetical protein